MSGDLRSNAASGTGSRAAGAWIAQHEAGVPAHLLEDILAAVAAVPDGDGVAGTLTTAAVRCLEQALAAGAARAAAGPLLAADALLTWAAEAATGDGSGADVTGSDALVQEISNRLADLVPRS